MLEDGDELRIKTGQKFVGQFKRPEELDDGGGKGGKGRGRGGRHGGRDGGRHGGTRGGRHGGRPSRSLISDAEYAGEYFEDFRRQAPCAFDDGHAGVNVTQMGNSHREPANGSRQLAEVISETIIHAVGRVGIEWCAAKVIGLGLEQGVQEAAEAVEEERSERLKARKTERLQSRKAERAERRAEGRAERRGGRAEGRVSDDCAAGAGGSGGRAAGGNGGSAAGGSGGRSGRRQGGRHEGRGRRGPVGKETHARPPQVSQASKPASHGSDVPEVSQASKPASCAKNDAKW